jgi:hypothetical protein
MLQSYIQRPPFTNRLNNYEQVSRLQQKVGSLERNLSTDVISKAEIEYQRAIRESDSDCRLIEKCLRRSARRKRRVSIVTDAATLHTPEGSRQVAELVKRSKRRLKLR